MKMKFNFLGGADMVGRMAMTMEGDGKTMLMEYGVSPTKPPEYLRRDVGGRTSMSCITAVPDC